MLQFVIFQEGGVYEVSVYNGEQSLLEFYDEKKVAKDGRVLRFYNSILFPFAQAQVNIKTDNFSYAF